MTGKGETNEGVRASPDQRLLGLPDRSRPMEPRLDAWRFQPWTFPISTSTTVATRDELFSTNEQLALAGFLAGYSGLTHDAYTLDLRQYVACLSAEPLST